MPAQTVIKLRRGTASQWTTANPVLAAGEIGLETDTLRTKYGNGSSTWTALSYSVADASGTSSVDWSAVLNKPSTFTPSSHTHPTSEVTGLDTALSGKAATVHTHTLSQITDYTPPVIPEVTFTNTFMLMGA
jgi:Major tropism determinant N-terminal domain/Phage tail repeat like